MATPIKESSSNAYNLKVLAESCQVNEILRTISPRWKMQILYCISQQVQQFSKLKEVFPTLSDQILGKRLGELVAEELVNKVTIENTVPSQIVYTVTPKATELLTIVVNLHHWGQKNDHK